MSSRKRTIDSFFGLPSVAAGSAKKPRASPPTDSDGVLLPAQKDHSVYSSHPAYPFSIPHLPAHITAEVHSLPASIGRTINDQPDLDLLYFEPYVPRRTDRELFTFLRAELPFYRVEYDITRFGTSTHIRTPRWTTVFGLDETSVFDPEGRVVDEKTGARVVGERSYTKYTPRPIPQCLDVLRQSCEAATGCKFNFCLVNYYANGADSISFHSDDERFLGPEPAIASFSLGARRDFMMKHKPPPAVPRDGAKLESPAERSKPLKLPLVSGDMVLMRGSTQANWLHSIPKRSGKNAEDGGRINITFRRAMIKAGTENYYNYNVGNGPVYRWNPSSREMELWRHREK
ncbi:DNA repair family protein-like protein [Xylariales sp. PMI_506]|nr:DNA repair family protein-like protein [Xylariales sp. PMI_506]